MPILQHRYNYENIHFDSGMTEFSTLIHRVYGSLESATHGSLESYNYYHFRNLIKLSVTNVAILLVKEIAFYFSSTEEYWIKNSAVEDSPRLLVHFMIEPHYQLVSISLSCGNALSFIAEKIIKYRMG